MRYLAGFVFALLVVLTWGFWRQQSTADRDGPFGQATITTAYVFGAVPYLEHDEDGTHLRWPGLALGGCVTVVSSLLLLRFARKRPDARTDGHA